MAFFGIHFEATDPKDHIYGLLALPGIDMVPDYNPSTPSKSVYSDYIASYLHFWSQYRAKVRLAHDYVEQHQLFFLHYFGIGLYKNILELPSWAPILPEESPKSIAGKYVEADADANAFGQHEDIAYVSQDTLFVIGIEFDLIVHVSRAPAEETWWDGSVLAYFKDLVSRNNLDRTTGLEPLQMILKAVELSHGKAANDENYLFFALRFLQFILSPEIVNTGSMNLSAIGLEESHFNDSFLKTFCPTYTGPQHDSEEGFLPRSVSQQVELRAELSGAVISTFVMLRKRWRSFETARGYFELCPIKSVVGDQVCVLKGSGMPVVLRKEDDDFYQHVGTCLVPGLMSGAAAAFVNVILNLGGSGDEQGDRLIWSLGMNDKVGSTFGLELF